MKNQKLRLDELKVQSFITDFDKDEAQTQEINGGFGPPDTTLCLPPTFLPNCDRFTITFTDNTITNNTITKPTLCNNSCFAYTCNYAFCLPDFTDGYLLK
jgi:hypothetical protein